MISGRPLTTRPRSANLVSGHADDFNYTDGDDGDDDDDGDD